MADCEFLMSLSDLVDPKLICDFDTLEIYKDRLGEHNFNKMSFSQLQNVIAPIERSSDYKVRISKEPIVEESAIEIKKKLPKVKSEKKKKTLELSDKDDSKDPIVEESAIEIKKKLPKVKSEKKKKTLELSDKDDSKEPIVEESAIEIKKKLPKVKSEKKKKTLELSDKRDSKDLKELREISKTSGEIEVSSKKRKEVPSDKKHLEDTEKMNVDNSQQISEEFKIDPEINNSEQISDKRSFGPKVPNNSAKSTKIVGKDLAGDIETKKSELEGENNLKVLDKIKVSDKSNSKSKAIKSKKQNSTLKNAKPSLQRKVKNVKKSKLEKKSEFERQKKNPDCSAAKTSSDTSSKVQQNSNKLSEKQAVASKHIETDNISSFSLQKGDSKKIKLDKVEFCRVKFGDKKKDLKNPLSGKDYKGLLKKVEDKDEKIRIAKVQDPEKGKALELDYAYSKALKKSFGVKLKDDKSRLKRASVKKEKSKLKSKQRHEALQDSLRSKKMQKQKTRAENIAKRRKLKI